MMRICTILLTAVLLSACTAEEPAPADGAQISVTASDGPVSVRVEVPSDEIRTVDTLSVVAELIVSPVVPPPLLALALEDAGWRIDRETLSPPRVRDDGMIVRLHTWEVSPGLAGAYTVPPAVVVWTDASGERRELIGAPISITVESVLGADDTLELEAPGDLDAEDGG